METLEAEVEFGDHKNIFGVTIMEPIEIVNEIETGNYPFIDGLDYYMDCKVIVNKVSTRAEQVSIVQCELNGEYGRYGTQYLLEIRRGDWITWAFLDEIETFEVKMYNKDKKELAI